jgi:uncharacterized protein (TIGR02246 family)
MEKESNRIIPALVMIAALVLGGCASTEQTEQAEAQMLHDRIMDTRFMIMDGDHAGYVKTFDENGVLLIHKRSPYIGHEGLTEFFQPMFSNNTIANRVHKIEEVRVSGDMAFAWGYFSDDFTPKSGGETQARSGKFLVVFKKNANGEWLRHALMPMPEPK